MSGPCGYPGKQRHRTFDAAMKARDHLEATEGIDIGLRPYRCGDHWHLGHREKPYGQRAITKAIERGTTNAKASRRRRTR